MWDKLLSVGTVFDWISPLLAAVQDVANGPSHTFLVPEACGWSAREIERLLTARGIRVWGLMIVRDTIMFSVRQSQARWAQYLLEREGIPIEAAFVHSAAGRSERSRTKTGPSAPHESIEDWFDELLNLLGL